MRIAQVSPLCESVPPGLYGGTERIVHYLTEELVQLGHDVTLFASGDSRTSARLSAQCRRSLRLNDGCVDPFPHHLLMLERVAARRHEFDVIHFHLDYLHFPTSRALGLTQLTTQHGRLDVPDLRPLYMEFRDLPLVSISDAQRRPLPDLMWAGTVHHGLPESLLEPNARPGDYFAFVGRVSPEKRVDRAIEVALALDMPIRIAAKIDKADRAYYEREIAALFRHPLVEYVGEIAEHEKSEFIGNARALLFPVDWPEPFGLVMIEAFACGTPVIAWRRGSVPEVMEDGVTGFVVDDTTAAIDAARRVGSLDRAAVRRVFEKRFTARRMAREYLELYRRIAAAPERPELVETGSSAA
jgi:glycosyltransferase involved in cell wall biosynthesis